MNDAGDLGASVSYLYSTGGNIASTYCSSKDTCGTDPGDGPANDEGDGVRRRATDCGTNLKEQDAGKEGVLDGVEGIYLAVKQLKGAAGEQVGTIVPTHIGKGVEFIGDARDGLKEIRVSVKSKSICVVFAYAGVIGSVGYVPLR